MGRFLIARPSESLRYRVYTRLFALGAAVHLTLPDRLDAPSPWPNVALLVGAGLVAVRGCLLGWILVALGTLTPILFLEDQLTQSGYQLACALMACTCFAGGPEGRAERMDGAFLDGVRSITAAVYLVAAFHKLNTGFFDVDVSCATAGVAVLADNWDLDLLLSKDLAFMFPPLFLVAEAGVAALLLVWPGAALVLGLVLHIPLTLVFAPAFAFVMAPGFAACLETRDLEHLGSVLRTRWPAVLGLGGLLSALSIGAYFERHWVHYPWWFVKEVALWLALALCLVAFFRRPPGVLAWRGLPRARARARRAVPIAFTTLFVLHALTPYTGLQFHHTGAMLSNLRIDRGCWNHLIVPEAVRLRDPYIRIDEAHVGKGAPGPDELEAWLERTLWSPETLLDARDRFCARGAGPVRVRAQTRQGTVESPDLCTDWPFARPLLAGYRAFQRNLAVRCPDRCIH